MVTVQMALTVTTLVMTMTHTGVVKNDNNTRMIYMTTYDSFK